jgi:hypothetical protein
MAGLYAIWKRLSHLRLDGVYYDVCGKVREDGRFTVAWVCLACCEQGPPIPAAKTLEQAVSLAHVGLRAHHGLVHSRRIVTTGGRAFSDGGPHEESGKKDSGPTAYEQFCAAWEKLCTAHARICSPAPDQSCTNTREHRAAAYRDWIASSRNFDATLQAYAAELSRRAHAIEAKLACSNGVPRQPPRPGQAKSRR